MMHWWEWDGKSKKPPRLMMSRSGACFGRKLDPISDASAGGYAASCLSYKQARQESTGNVASRRRATAAKIPRD